MKVLFIENAGLLSAGAFHSLIALVKKLDQYNVQSYIALPDRAEGCQLLKKNHIEYFPLRACAYSQMISQNASFLERIKMPFKDIIVKKEAAKLAKYVKNNSIDVIHENTSACYIGYYAAKKSGAKHVWHIREFMEEDFGAALWKRNRAIKMFNNSDAIIAISKAIEQKYWNDIADKNKIHLIYNGVDIQKFYIEEHPVFDKNGITVLCVGRVCAGKGQDIVVTAAGILYKTRNIKIEVLLAGTYDTDTYEKIMDIAKEYDITDQVKFLGQCNDIMSIYLKTDILCMASKCEAFGRVTVEAMLAGCLVVGANSGGTKEIINDGENGILFETGNSDDLAARLYEVLSDKERMKKIAEAGKESAVQKYDAKINAKKIYELYQNLLNEKKEFKNGKH